CRASGPRCGPGRRTLRKDGSPRHTPHPRGLEQERAHERGSPAPRNGNDRRPLQRNPLKEWQMKWITRKNVKVDRVACPWLIRRFVDKDAEFIFVEEEQLLRLAESMKAIPYDAPRIAEIKLNHRGQRCTFEAILEDYKLDDPALQRLALIVRAADIKGQEQ